MASKTFEAYHAMVGKKAAQHPNLETACDSLDEMACSDLTSLMTVMSEVRSHEVSTRSIIEGNRFHEPSMVSQKLFHLVEEEIFKSLPDAEFIELSPLQPFGINTVLAGSNEKNVVAALRNSEVNADVTTALFRLAINKFNMNSGETITLASNARTVRAQIFDAETKFLPHFKVLAEVSVGRQSPKYGAKELETLSDHLANEIDVLDRVSQLPNSRIKKIQISIGNVLLTNDLISRKLIDGEEIRRHTIDPNYNVFKESNLDIPPALTFDDPDISNRLKDLGFNHGVKITGDFQRIISEKHPLLSSRLVLDLGRIAGAGYYKHIAYKISAENNQGIVLPLADGGSTNWAEKVTYNKQLYSVTSGIGTELLCNYFL